MGLSAMFPLGTVLLPGSILPLHVFEPRYRRMVDDCLAGPREFGVALITRGREVGGGDARAMVATVARIAQHRRLDDDRRFVLAVGLRRVRVDEWLADDPYPRALVTDWPDDEHHVEPGRIEHVAGLVRGTIALAEQLGEAVGDVESVIVDDPSYASYQLAALAPLGPFDQLAMLNAPGPAARLDALEQAVADVWAGLRFRLDLPPENDG